MEDYKELLHKDVTLGEAFKLIGHIIKSLNYKEIFFKEREFDHTSFLVYMGVLSAFFMIDIFGVLDTGYYHMRFLFDLYWSLIITLIVMSFKHHRVLFTLFYFGSLINFLIHHFHLMILKLPMSFSELFYAGEGLKYYQDIIKAIDIKLVIEIIIAIAVYVAFLFIFKREVHRLNKLVCTLLIVLVLMIHDDMPKLLGFRETNSLFKATTSLKNIYEDFSDRENAYKITGIYEYVVRDIEFFIRDNYSRDSQKELKTIEGYFNSRNLVIEENEYSNIFKDKNLIVILGESMDNWLITEKTTPMLYEMRENGFNFANRYAPSFGGGKTLNTEFALNTGNYIPMNYNIFASTNNKFSHSIANKFKKAGYKTTSLHFNTGKYYGRNLLHPSFGYEQYRFIKDELGKSYTNDLELLQLDGVYDSIVSKDQKFMSFWITYSAHLSYTKSNKMCSDIDNEFDCINHLASITDSAIKYLVDRLDSDGLLEDTVIVFVTDHYAVGYSEEGIHEIKGGDTFAYLDKLPFIIWNKEYEGVTTDKYVDTQDVVPTLLNMFGIPYTNDEYIGTDVFSNCHNNYVFFRDYTYVGDEISEEDMIMEMKINTLMVKRNY